MIKYNSLSRIVLPSLCLYAISKFPLGSLIFTPAVSALHTQHPEGVSASSMGNPQHNVYLGGTDDRDPQSFDLTISKEQIDGEHVVHLEVDGHTSTGHSYMCVDVFKGPEHNENTLDQVKELGNTADRETKTNAIQKGCDKFGISLGAFSPKSTPQASREGGGTCGAPSKLAAKLVVKPEVEVGTYVLVVAQGSAFRQEPYTHLKQIHLRIVN